MGPWGLRNSSGVSPGGSSPNFHTSMRSAKTRIWPNPALHKNTREFCEMLYVSGLRLKLKLPGSSGFFQNVLSFIDTANAIAAFYQWMPAMLLSQPKTVIDHFNDHPALRCV
jgi:hypothetical protein